MDFEGGAELNGWLYGLTDQPPPFYEGMRGYLTSEGDSESLAMLADSENHLPQHRISIDSAALMLGQRDAKALELSRNLLPARFTEVAKVFEPVSMTAKESRRLRFDD